MKTLLAAGGVAVLGMIFAPTISAQWPTDVPPSVPRTADGKPNLDAPAPRTADGHPDLSGLWENGRPGGRGATGQGGDGRGAGGRSAPPVLPADGSPPLATFANVGAGFPDGLPFQPWAKELLAKRRAENDKDNPDAHCLPMGLLQFHEHIQPRKIVQEPGLIVIIYEANYGLRQIFMDGRSLPGKDAEPWWYGYSVGKWDGDTLVVETTGLKDGGWLDIWGSPLTDQAKITERFRRPSYGTLIVDVTIDDPKAYTRPFTVRFNQHIMPDGELIEFICNENERSDAHLVGK